MENKNKNNLDELPVDSGLDHTSLVEASCHFVEIDDRPHIFPQLFDQANIDVSFQECSADLLQHRVQNLPKETTTLSFPRRNVQKVCQNICERFYLLVDDGGIAERPQSGRDLPT